jgi:hypothetical protein
MRTTTTTDHPVETLMFGLAQKIRKKPIWTTIMRMTKRCFEELLQPRLPKAFRFNIFLHAKEFTLALMMMMTHQWNIHLINRLRHWMM